MEELLSEKTDNCKLIAGLIFNCKFVSGVNQ
jgi:hypothetical protein